jgi:hypothetical protein
MLRKTTVLALGIVLAWTAGSGCASSDGNQNDGAPATDADAGIPSSTINPEMVGDLGANGTSLAVMQSLPAMVHSFEYVIVGTVIEFTGVQYKQSPSDLWADPPLPGLPYSIHSISVLETISGDEIKAGDIISLSHAGYRQIDGSPVVPEPLPAGSTYLFFLADVRDIGLPGFQGISAGRFAISDDGYVLANGSECADAGPRDVSGVTKEQCQAAADSADPQVALAALREQTLNDAKAKILAAIAEDIPSPSSAPRTIETTPAHSTAPLSAPSPAPSGVHN